MGQDKEEYVFYERRRLEKKMTDMPMEEKGVFLIGERATAQNRRRRLLEEVEKIDAAIPIIMEMEKENK